MKKTAYPTYVNLKELPLEGESFDFSRETGELDDALQDLIGDYDYQVEMQLTPAGNAFAISGHIETSAELQCARCGRDTKQEIRDDFNELILVMKERPRSGHSGHTGTNLIDGPYCNYTTSYEFNLSEFTHEHVASAIPYTPYCGLKDCEEYFQKAQEALSEGFSEEKPNNPFTALKNLNSKTQRS